MVVMATTTTIDQRTKPILLRVLFICTVRPQGRGEVECLLGALVRHNATLLFQEALQPLKNEVVVLEPLF